MGRILVVDDEPSMRRILASNLRQDHHEIHEASGVEEAQRTLAANDFDVVVTDQRMPDGEGLAVLAAAHENDATLPVIFLTAVASIELAVESMRQGAFDFLTKPFQPEVVRATVRRACERTRLLRENILLKDAVVRLEGASEIYGESAPMQAVRERIARVAPTSATVLITGETGTGKELVARAIHRNSPRASKPFVAVNCAAFTETLLESELFGHEKGAFTDARVMKPGIVEIANKGTLFLDEIGDISPIVQPKILRFIQSGEFRRVGGNTTLTADVRILSATNKNLKDEVKEGRFREDLLYRINVITIDVPLLRARKDDIPLLVAHFINNRMKTKTKPTVSSKAMEILIDYDWPGNIRELENVIERAAILCRNGVIDPQDLSLPNAPMSLPSGGRADNKLGTALPLKEIERLHIEGVLRSFRGNKAEAAKILGISLKTLYTKIQQYQIKLS